MQDDIRYTTLRVGETPESGRLFPGNHDLGGNRRGREQGRSHLRAIVTSIMTLTLFVTGLIAARLLQSITGGVGAVHALITGRAAFERTGARGFDGDLLYLRARFLRALLDVCVSAVRERVIVRNDVALPGGLGDGPGEGPGDLGTTCCQQQ